MAEAPELIRVEVPAPATAEERDEARKIGKLVNPAHRWPESVDATLKREPLPPDSSMLDEILRLARALWRGEEVTVQFEQWERPWDTAERAALEELADKINPDDGIYVLRETGVGAALADINQRIRAALLNVRPNAVRCNDVLENALFDLHYLTNIQGSDDKPLMSLYGDALLKGECDRQAIDDQRQRLRELYEAAERALDLADRELAQGGAR